MRNKKKKKKREGKIISDEQRDGYNEREFVLQMFVPHIL